MGTRGLGRVRRDDEVVALAEQLFLERGYAQTTVDDILERSGLSKGGFYHYFDSKEAVLRASINRLMRRRLDEVTTIVADAERSALEKLRALLASRAQLQGAERETARYLGMIMQSDFTLFQYYTALARTFVEPFAQIIEQGVREGTFRVSAPRETADLLIRAVASFPQSALFAEAVDDPGALERHSTAVNELIAGALGIRPQELSS